MDLTRSYSARPPHASSGPSLLLAVAGTAAMLAAAFLAGNAVSHDWWDRDLSPPVAERVTYVAPPVTAPPVVPVAPTAPAAPGRAAAPTVVPSTIPPAGTSVSGPTTTAPRVTPVPVPGAADTGAARTRPGAAAGAPARGPTQYPNPARVGAELPQSPPLTRGQRDSLLRVRMNEVFGNPTIRAEAVAMAANAAAIREDQANRELGRTAGGGQPRAHGLKLNLLKIPFGGRSPEQQRRDSIVDADTRARLARIGTRGAQQRADSIRRDSLRLAADSLLGRRPTRRDSL